jgi:eukaryotic-like serine/threonine-protein kinase
MSELRPGMLFADRYEILAVTGRGGMGHVYRARHIGLAKDVALKVLATDATGDYHLRFAREARALARVDHPNCIRVLDYGDDDGTQYIAMEHLDGETLAAHLVEHGRLPTQRALSITRQLLFALAHAHAQGVIHRDVKPENVMLAKGRAILIDFGLASIADEASFTGNGMCLGSPSYLAPERLLGQPHDTRTDLYAIGVILYEMVAGVRPFKGDSPQETMQLALHRPPRPLRAVRRDIPPVLERVISRALAKDPARRYADAEAMLLALNDVPSDEEIAEAEHADAAETLAMEALRIAEPSRLARLWTWLRYGGWRWKHS